MGMPPLEYERGMCPRCKARTNDQAATMCLPWPDETGEGTCPAERDDEEGFLLFPTEASIKRLDDWCGEQMVAEGWADSRDTRRMAETGTGSVRSTSGANSSKSNHQAD